MQTINATQQRVELRTRQPPKNGKRSELDGEKEKLSLCLSRSLRCQPSAAACTAERMRCQVEVVLSQSFEQVAALARLSLCLLLLCSLRLCLSSRSHSLCDCLCSLMPTVGGGLNSSGLPLCVGGCFFNVVVVVIIAAVVIVVAVIVVVFIVVVLFFCSLLLLLLLQQRPQQASF